MCSWNYYMYFYDDDDDDDDAYEYGISITQQKSRLYVSINKGEKT